MITVEVVVYKVFCNEDVAEEKGAEVVQERIGFLLPVDSPNANSMIQSSCISNGLYFGDPINDFIVLIWSFSTKKHVVVEPSTSLTEILDYFKENESNSDNLTNKGPVLTVQPKIPIVYTDDVAVFRAKMDAKEIFYDPDAVYPQYQICMPTEANEESFDEMIHVPSSIIKAWISD